MHEPVILILILVFARANCSNLTANCGNATHNLDNEWRIIGGTKSNFSEWPWQVELRREMGFNGQNYVLTECGATIITEQWLVTAAHCVHFDSSPSNYFVYMGYSNLSQELGGELRLPVSKIIAHELFNYDHKAYDLALIRLNETLDFEHTHRHLRPICVPDLHNEPTEKCFATGYGRQDTEGTIQDKSLMKVAEPIFNITQCEKLMEDISIERNICAGGTAKDGFGTCNGDSGGPLACLASDGKWYLTGVTSWGLPCAHANVPDVFTRVAFYHDWIAKNIQ